MRIPDEINQVLIISRILAERARQDEQWGGPSHDDQHDAVDFMQYIAAQIRKFQNGFPIGSYEYGQAVTAVREFVASEACEERFVKIAALALAYLESAARKKAAVQEVSQ